MSIEVIDSDPRISGGVGAFYRSDTTRALDQMYGLDSPELIEYRKRTVRNNAFAIGHYTSRAVMIMFAWAAGQFGSFIGLPKHEVPHVWRISEGDIDATIREGWLQEYEHEGVAVVEPSLRYGEEFTAARRVSESAPATS